jgi:enamine deaminase RidA (YjgF/YER057c/UK114 family)
MAAFTLSNPEGVLPPISCYSHAALIAGPPRRLVISGQVGIARDGSVPESGEAQVTQAFANLNAILGAHGMGFADVLKTTAFVTDRAMVPIFRAHRDRLFAAHPPASTLVIVAGLVDPRLKVEIEAEAVAG